MSTDLRDSIGREDDPGERPPLFKTWRRWYGAILLELVVLIIVFRLITVIFE